MELTILDDDDLVIHMISKEGTSGGEENLEVKYSLETGKATALVDGSPEELPIYMKDGNFLSWNR